MSREDRRDRRRLACYRAVLAGATLLMVGLSWPLWAASDAFPRIPFVAGWPEPGGRLAGALAWILAGALALVALGRGGRWDWLTSLIALAWLILGDQARLQPWAQQYAVVALAAACLPRGRALGVARWYVVVLYAASALSKFDAAFVDELGETFVATLARLVGRDAAGWSPGTRLAAALALPTGELAVAVALAVPRLRGWGLAGSMVQHGATLAVLGPWGVDHSANVLIWNVAMALENLALFWPAPGLWEPRPGASRAVVVLVVALVGLERWGWVDSWPAHALYASHAERAAILWPEAAADALPPAIRRWLGPADAEGECRLDLTGWSRAARGVPVYPQGRVACGIATALVARYAPATGPMPRAILWGRAGLGRGTPRVRVKCVGLAALRRRGDRFLINARPAPGFGR